MLHCTSSDLCKEQSKSYHNVAQKNACRATKIILYKTLIRRVVSYGAEAWMLTKEEEQAVLIFERKIFIRIYGPNVKTGNGKVGRIEN